MAVDAERLRELFEQPGLGWLVDRLEERVRRGQPLRGSVGRRRPSAEERRTVERLLGRPPGRG
ncbi:MAG: TIGR02679 family protein, partial [Acidobacteriota bacterium]